MRLQIIYFLLLTVLISYRRSYVYGQDQGVLIVKRCLYESDITMEISRKIYYKNRLSIQEIVELNTYEDDSTGKSFSTRTLSYSYLDPVKNLCYNYKTFSDTARLLKYYADIDSVRIAGGWNFYSDEKYPFDSLVYLKDTIINEVYYKRAKIENKGKQKKYFNTYFFRCDKTGAMVAFYKSLSDMIKCPAVRVDTFKDDKLISSVEIIFLSNQLSKEELKVFEAWENNTKENK